MTETTPFTIGAGVSCSDGACGKVTRVVVDPLTRTVTHLVVEPKHRLDAGRLSRSAWPTPRPARYGSAAP